MNFPACELIRPLDKLRHLATGMAPPAKLGEAFLQDNAVIHFPKKKNS